MEQWPSYLSLTTGFSMILVMRVQSLYSEGARNWMPGCILPMGPPLAVTFVPYPTSVWQLIQKLRAANAGGGIKCPVSLIVVIAICFNLVLRAAFRREPPLPL